MRRIDKCFSWDRYITRDPRVPIWVMRRTSQNPVETHQHAFGELVIILGGHGIHFTGREKYPVIAGDVFVIDGTCAHGYQDTEKLDLLNVVFNHERLRFPLLDAREMPGFTALFELEPRYRAKHRFTSRLHLSPQDLAVAAAIAARLETECKGRKAGYVFAATALFMELVAYLSRCYSRTQSNSPLSLLRLADAVSYLERHYADRLSLADLCRISHMSRNTLAVHFKRALGCSPVAHLIRLRVAKAAELLRDEQLPITEVAFRAGFTDSNYFTRQFRRVMGTPPRAFRRQYAQGIQRSAAP